MHRLVPDDVRPRLTQLYRPLLARGGAVGCPVCGRRFSHFLAHRGQANARCPLCGSMERHRLLWLWLRAESDFFTAPLRVLHFAPEFGIKQRLSRQSNLNYATADLGSRLADEHFDITEIPHPDGSFDVILCNHVLEHVAEDRKAMQELHRILRPGGWAVLMTPVGKGVPMTEEGVIDPDARLRRFGQEDHVRLYGQDFYDRLRDAGFEVEVVDYVAQLPRKAVEFHCLERSHAVFEDDVIIVGRKPAAARR